jgi:protein-S-isoprenylcysteine O-methyltransferase Ste14
VLPVGAAVVVPGLLVHWHVDGPDSSPLGLLRLLAGSGLAAAGLSLVCWTVSLFATRGRGTLAPWHATQRLVVQGPYRHVRNPMISGVAAILLGEAALLASVRLVAWFAIFVAVNAVYIPLVEEPGLVRRFGEDYRVYGEHVPRWLPRATAWRGAAPS